MIILTYFSVSPLTIMIHPTEELHILAGDSVTFTVVATGELSTFIYEWRKDGDDLVNNAPVITGADTATLSISQLKVNDEGDYNVFIMNDAGGIASNVAALSFRKSYMGAHAGYHTRGYPPLASIPPPKIFAFRY